MNEIKRDIKLLVPELQGKIICLLDLLEKHNIPMKIFETLRTAKRQEELFKKGFSKTLKSKHIEGRACDMVVHFDEKWSWANEYIYLYKMMGCLVEKIGGLTWGGSWKWKDYAHIELKV